MSSFNPYFTGSNSGSSKVRSSYEHKEEVSILILLEVILEAFLYEQNDRLLLVSILILLEVILEVAYDVLYVLNIALFQSLFYWK